VGKRVDSLIAPQDFREEAEELTKRTNGGSTIHIITKRMGKDGNLLDVEIFAGPLEVKGKRVGSYAQYKDIISAYGRVLKKDGIFIGTFRSKHYFITTLLRQKQFDKALFVARNSEGLLKLASISSYYNWQTPKEISHLLADNGLELLKIYPVGVFSGSGYDGLAAVVDVDQLSKEEIHSGLYELESTEWDDCLGSGRFIMAIGRKSDPS